MSTSKLPCKIKTFKQQAEQRKFFEKISTPFHRVVLSKCMHLKLFFACWQVEWRLRQRRSLISTSFSFRKGVGTRDWRESIAVVKLVNESCVDHKQVVYVWFVDKEKAFNRVNWVKLLEVLKSIGVDWHDRWLIERLLWGKVWESGWKMAYQTQQWSAMEQDKVAWNLPYSITYMLKLC